MAGHSKDATLLFGRDKDLELLYKFVDESSSDGDALLLFGAPGAGKTVLLDAAAARAVDTAFAYYVPPAQSSRRISASPA